MAFGSSNNPNGYPPPRAAPPPPPPAPGVPNYPRPAPDPTSIYSSGNGSSALDPGEGNRYALGIAAGQAGAFGQAGQGQFLGADQQNMAATNDYLTGLMHGQNSVSAEQLRQGLQSNIAAQQAQAASAGPRNQAAAMQLAMNNSAKLGYGMSGQQAVAGLQERNQAAQQLSTLQTAQRAQDLQAALGGYQNAITGFGQATANPGQSGFQAFGQIAPAIAGGIGMMAMSDRRAKKNVADADDESKRLLDGLKTYRFRYKDERNGKGSQLGVMAQDMLRAGLGHAVVDTPRGKMVDGAKTATSALALTAALARRVSKLESLGK